eukprot:scaffold135524_cov46-Prasinocladus_malaysianus.AAC.2
MENRTKRSLRRHLLSVALPHIFASLFDPVRRGLNHSPPARSLRYFQIKTMSLLKWYYPHESDGSRL